MDNSHSGPGVATSPNSTDACSRQQEMLGGGGHTKGGGASGASEGDLHPLFQISSSLHEIVPHRNKAQKSALTLTLHPPQERPNSIFAKHWTPPY